MNYLEQANQLRDERLHQEKMEAKRKLEQQQEESLKKQRLLKEEKSKVKGLFKLMKQFDGFDINKSGKKLNVSLEMNNLFHPSVLFVSDSGNNYFYCAFNTDKETYYIAIDDVAGSTTGGLYHYWRHLASYKTIPEIMDKMVVELGKLK